MKAPKSTICPATLGDENDGFAPESLRAELAQLTDEATRERELGEAHRLFVEIGAPIRAAEVARELA